METNSEHLSERYLARSSKRKPHANPVKRGARCLEIASAICACGHALADHHYTDCLFWDSLKLCYCKCSEFRPMKKPVVRSLNYAQ